MKYEVLLSPPFVELGLPLTFAPPIFGAESSPTTSSTSPSSGGAVAAGAAGAARAARAAVTAGTGRLDPRCLLCSQISRKLRGEGGFPALGGDGTADSPRFPNGVRSLSGISGGDASAPCPVRSALRTIAAVRRCKNKPSRAALSLLPASIAATCVAVGEDGGETQGESAAAAISRAKRSI